VIYDNVETGLNSVLFPIREVKVYAETEPGNPSPIPGKKALINDNTGRVLSVVSERYQVLHNWTALDLAWKCCIAAFPNTATKNWQVYSVEAPMTGGHCHIDLKHEKEISGYDWSFSNKDQDMFEPFIRVSNSYNRTRVFAIRFGLVRWACTNGLVDWHSSITIRVAHDVKKMERSIEAQINEAKFRKVFCDFRDLIARLRRAQVPEARFRPLMLSVLQIRKPSLMPESREKDWKCLGAHLDRVSTRYANEMGATGYALMNAITDVASHPPVNFIRRERDGLQRLVSVWLAEIARQPHSLAELLGEAGS
jgi:hypothetical protein